MTKTESLLKIKKLLEENPEGYTKKEFSLKLNCSEKTIDRRFRELEKELGYKVIKSNKGKKYQYALSIGSLTNTFGKQQELSILFLSLLKSITSKGKQKYQRNYFPLKDDDIKALIKEIESNFSKEEVKLSGKIKYFFSELEPANIKYIDNFNRIIEAFRLERKLDIKYESTSKDMRNNYLVSPQLLINYSGKWYLLAENNNKKLNLLLTSRFKSIIITKESSYSSYSDKDLRHFLTKTFGIIKDGKEPVIAKIRFYPPVSNGIKNIKWHPDQKTFTKEEFTEFQLPINSFDNEFIGRALRYGVHAEIIEPESTREKWLKEIEKMYQKYF